MVIGVTQGYSKTLEINGGLPCRHTRKQVGAQFGLFSSLNTPTAGITFKVDEERKIFCIFLGLINSSLDKRLLKFVNSASLNLIRERN